MATLTFGVSATKKRTWLSWAELIFDRVPFTHAYVGFEECGRQKVYHTTGARNHVVSLYGFLHSGDCDRNEYATWSIDIPDAAHERFLDEIYFSAARRKYGRLQLPGIIIARLLGMKHNPLGRGDQDHCSETVDDILRRYCGVFVVRWQSGGWERIEDKNLTTPADIYWTLANCERATPVVTPATPPPTPGSPRFKVNKTDLQKVLRGALIVGFAAAATYAAEAIADVDFGDMTALVVMGVSIVANFARKWAADYSKGNGK